MIDIKFDADGDIDLSNGDIHYGVLPGQHQQDLIIVSKGHLKGSPAVGVGAINYLNDEDPENFLRKVRREFIADGMNVVKVGINKQGNLIVDAHYKES